MALPGRNPLRINTSLRNCNRKKQWQINIFLFYSIFFPEETRRECFVPIFELLMREKIPNLPKERLEEGAEDASPGILPLQVSAWISCQDAEHPHSCCWNFPSSFLIH